ncbi:MAG: S46 family peptidase [Myxococcota bacterium]|nr:S46 family peptidase [Myxococcota bacterium]
MLLQLLPLLFAPPAQADEGMWLPEQLKDYADDLESQGLELAVKDLANPKTGPLGAVVWIGHCSGAFVSEDGLLVTNAHCARSYLQYASSADTDLVVNGYSAQSRDEELWAGPSARLFVMEAVEDVTEFIHDELDKVRKDGDRYEALERARKEVIAECETEPGRRCQIAEFYGGLEYRLISRKEIKDLRIVNVPAESVAMFGGEDDNWMWPRHTGDYAFLRAYVSPDGTAAANAQDNVPFKPASFLPVQPDGVKPSDFVLIAGYPGATYRYRSAAEIAHAQSVRYPEGIALFTELMESMTAHAKQSDEAAKKIGNYIFSLGNQRKSYRGMLENFEQSGLVQRKAAEFKELQDWVDDDRRRRRAYEKSLTDFQNEIESNLATYQRDRLVGLTSYFPQLLRVTRVAYRLSVEREKSDIERRRGYQARDEQRIEDNMRQIQRSLYMPADKDLATIVLGHILSLPEGQSVAPIADWIEGQGGLEKAIETLYTEPAYVAEDARLALLKMDQAAMEASDDPWIQLAVAIEGWVDQQRAEEDRFRGAMLRLRPSYMQALIEMKGGDLYPDANGTLRVSVGNVKGYSPSEAVSYQPLTTVSGMLAKEGAPPFNVDANVKEQADEQGRSVPLNFLTTLDNTGGNSGSPTMNGKGELVGLVFDRNYEAMAADWMYDPDLTRTIHVDIRFVIWMLRNVADSEWLLTEMGLN